MNEIKRLIHGRRKIFFFSLKLKRSAETRSIAAKSFQISGQYERNTPEDNFGRLGDKG